MKKEEVIAKMQSGTKLFQYKSFRMSGRSFTGKVLSGDSITYKFEDGTKVHHFTGNALLKAKIIEKGTATRTLGGWKTEMKLKA